MKLMILATALTGTLLTLGARTASAFPLPAYDCKLFDPIHHVTKSFQYQMMLRSQQIISGKIDLRISAITGGKLAIGLYETGVEGGPYASFYAEGTQTSFGATLARDQGYVAIVQCTRTVQH